MSFAPLAALVIALFIGASCTSEQPSNEPGGASGSAGAAGAAGAATLELELELGNFIEEDAPMVMLTEGSSVQLTQAVQGGWVIYIGAKVKHLASDQAVIVAKLIDPTSGVVRREDKRTIVMKPVDGEPEVKQPDLRSRSQVAHLWVCPNDDTRDIAGQSWLLDVTLSAPDGSASGHAELTVMPVCQEPNAADNAACACECAAGYAFGKCN